MAASNKEGRNKTWVIREHSKRFKIKRKKKNNHGVQFYWL